MEVLQIDPEFVEFLNRLGISVDEYLQATIETKSGLIASFVKASQLDPAFLKFLESKGIKREEYLNSPPNVKSELMNSFEHKKGTRHCLPYFNSSARQTFSHYFFLIFIKPGRFRSLQPSLSMLVADRLFS